jgi:hypothetical protein
VSLTGEGRIFPSCGAEAALSRISAGRQPSKLAAEIGHDVDRIDLDAALQQVSRHCGNAVAAVVIAPVGNHHQDPARAMSMARNRATQYDATEQRCRSVRKRYGFATSGCYEANTKAVLGIFRLDCGAFGCGYVFSAEEFLESGKLAQTACLDAIT